MAFGKFLAISELPDAFKLRQHGPTDTWNVVGNLKEVGIPNGAKMALARNASGDGRGWIINLGPSIISFSYWIYRDTVRGAQQVGPTTDYLMPMQAREIGLGPNMQWHISAH